MPIVFTCPDCGRKSEVVNPYAGPACRCAGCGAPITMPAPSMAVTLGCLMVCGGVLVALLAPALLAPSDAGHSSRCSLNLKQIGIALHAYHDAYQTLPPAYIADADGQPMHSWRVLILPFLEHWDLYDRYDFNEAWDGPNNQQLASLMPSAYACPSDPTAAISGITSYAVVVGPGTLFDGPDGHTFADIRDGSSSTIAVVEAGHAGVNWMEPKDLSLAQMSLSINGGPAEISSYHPAGAQVVMADGTVKMLPNALPAESLKAMLTRASGDHVPPSF